MLREDIDNISSSTNKNSIDNEGVQERHAKSMQFWNRNLEMRNPHNSESVYDYSIN